MSSSIRMASAETRPGLLSGLPFRMIKRLHHFIPGTLIPPLDPCEYTLFPPFKPPSRTINGAIPIWDSVLKRPWDEPSFSIAIRQPKPPPAAVPRATNSPSARFTADGLLPLQAARLLLMKLSNKLRYSVHLAVENGKTAIKSNSRLPSGLQPFVLSSYMNTCACSSCGGLPTWF